MDAMALPDNSYQDAHVDAPDSLPAHPADRSDVRDSHSDDSMGHDLAALAMGVYAGHAVHHRGRDGLHGRGSGPGHWGQRDRRFSAVPISYYQDICLVLYKTCYRLLDHTLTSRWSRSGT